MRNICLEVVWHLCTVPFFQDQLGLVPFLDLGYSNATFFQSLGKMERRFLHLDKGCPLEMEFYTMVAATFSNLENVTKYKPIVEEKESQETETHQERMKEWLEFGEKLERNWGR